MTICSGIARWCDWTRSTEHKEKISQACIFNMRTYMGGSHLDDCQQFQFEVFFDIEICAGKLKAVVAGRTGSTTRNCLSYPGPPLCCLCLFHGDETLVLYDRCPEPGKAIKSASANGAWTTTHLWSETKSSPDTSQKNETSRVWRLASRGFRHRKV